MDRFLLAYNPNTEGSSGLFIVHCLPPMLLIEVSKSPPAKRASYDPGSNFLTLEAGNEVWYLTAISELSRKEVLRIMLRAMYWFKAHRLNAQVGLSK